MPETLGETFRKVSRRGSDLSSSPSHFLRTQFRKSAAFSVERKKKEEKKNRFVHFHLDADKIFDEKLCICLCISREIISNRVNILVEIGGKGNLPWQRLSLWNGSRCLDALSRFICPRRCRRRRRRDSSARSKGKLKFSPTTVHQNSISPFSTASTSVKGEGKFSNAASRWQATGFGMIDRNGQLWRALVSRYEDGKYELDGIKIHLRFRCKWKRQSCRRLLNTFSLPMMRCWSSQYHFENRCPIAFSFRIKKSSTRVFQ